SSFTTGCVLNATPAVAVLDGCVVTTNWLAAAALTVTASDVPAIGVVDASLIVTVLLPAVFSVTPNVPVPLAIGVSAGNAACGSLLAKWTVPPKLATLPKA